MVLTLYGQSYTPCTQSVGLVLHEKKVAFKFGVVGMATGQHKSGEYLKKQPFGQVPVLDVRMPLDKCLVLTLFSRTMVSYFTRVVPSLAISPPSMQIRARHSSRQISRPMRSSSKPPPSKPPTSIPLYLKLFVRKYSSGRRHILLPW